MFKKIIEFFMGTPVRESTKEEIAQVQAVIKQAKNTIKRAATEKAVAKNAAKKAVAKKKPAAKKTVKKVK